MKNKNNGFTLIEILVALFICSIMLIFIIPNLINEYHYMKKMENHIELKEILYEELLNNDEDFILYRDDYKIVLENNKAYIENSLTGERLYYE